VVGDELKPGKPSSPDVNCEPSAPLYSCSGTGWHGLPTSGKGAGALRSSTVRVVEARRATNFSALGYSRIRGLRAPRSRTEPPPATGDRQTVRGPCLSSKSVHPRVVEARRGRTVPRTRVSPNVDPSAPPGRPQQPAGVWSKNVQVVFPGSGVYPAGRGQRWPAPGRRLTSRFQVADTAGRGTGALQPRGSDQSPVVRTATRPRGVARSRNDEAVRVSSRSQLGAITSGSSRPGRSPSRSKRRFTQARQVTGPPRVVYRGSGAVGDPVGLGRPADRMAGLVIAVGHPSPVMGPRPRSRARSATTPPDLGPGHVVSSRERTRGSRAVVDVPPSWGRQVQAHSRQYTLERG